MFPIAPPPSPKPQYDKVGTICPHCLKPVDKIKDEYIQYNPPILWLGSRGHHIWHRSCHAISGPKEPTHGI